MSVVERLATPFSYTQRDFTSHTVNAPAEQAGAKPELCYQNNTITVFLFEANKIKTMSGLL